MSFYQIIDQQSSTFQLEYYSTDHNSINYPHFKFSNKNVKDEQIQNQEMSIYLQTGKEIYKPSSEIQQLYLSIKQKQNNQSLQINVTNDETNTSQSDEYNINYEDNKLNNLQYDDEFTVTNSFLLCDEQQQQQDDQIGIKYFNNIINNSINLDNIQVDINTEFFLQNTLSSSNEQYNYNTDIQPSINVLRDNDNYDNQYSEIRHAQQSQITIKNTKKQKEDDNITIKFNSETIKQKELLNEKTIKKIKKNESQLIEQEKNTRKMQNSNSPLSISINYNLEEEPYYDFNQYDMNNSLEEDIQIIGFEQNLFSQSINPTGQISQGELIGKYQKLGQIYKGVVSDVYEGQFTNDKGEVEKCVLKIFENDKYECYQYEKYNQIVFKNCPRIIQLIDYQIINQKCILVTKKGKYTLKKQLKAFKDIQKFCIFILYQIIFEILYGLIYMKSKNFIHGDIKPENIIYGMDLRYYIIDLGTASEMNEDGRFQNIGYTYEYASPEQNDNKDIDYMTDVFSFGKTLMEVLDTFEQINQGKYGEQIVLQLRKLIVDNMLQNEKKNRKDIYELHQLFKQLCKQQIPIIHQQSWFFNEILKINENPNNFIWD